MKQITSAQKGQPNRISFTEKALAKIPIPAAGTDGQVRQIDYHDETTPGLTSRASSTGAKSWCFVTRVQRNGTTTPDRTTFGAYPDLSLSQVRGMVLELEKAIKQGMDPREIRQQKSNGTTEGPIVGT